MSPEGVLRLVLFGGCVIDFDHLNPVVVAAAKHEAFLKARGRHYSNEAEAMKVRICTFSRWISLFVLCTLITWVPSLACGQTYRGRGRRLAGRSTSSYASAFR